MDEVREEGADQGECWGQNENIGFNSEQKEKPVQIFWGSSDIGGIMSTPYSSCSLGTDYRETGVLIGNTSGEKTGHLGWVVAKLWEFVQ